jgi:hypothetical protein
MNLKMMIKRLRKVIHRYIVRIRYANAEKIICIGKNKTGTTSLASYFKNLGFEVAPQKDAEQLIFDWHKEEYQSIIDYVRHNGQFFQDVPFSLVGTYKILDKSFPNSKFILTVRDSPSEWYNSLVNFHSKLWGNGKVPTKKDLQQADYRYHGYAWEAFSRANKTPEDDLYNKDILIHQYETHNREVIDYFRDRPEKLLIVNLKDPEASQKLATYLSLKNTKEIIPWENKTSKLKTASQ